MMYFSAAGGSGPGENTRASVSLSNMPLFHIGGLNVSGTPAIWIGGTTVIMRMFDPEATLDAINSPDLGITSLFMVPAAYNALKAHPKSEDGSKARVSRPVIGAESFELIAFFDLSFTSQLFYQIFLRLEFTL